MTTVQFKSEVSIELDQLLTGVAQLDTPDLEKLLVQVRQVLAHRQNPSLPVLEIELLQKINQALPEEALVPSYVEVKVKHSKGCNFN